MSEDMRTARTATIFFNAVMTLYQITVPLLCIKYHLYLLLIVLIINLCISCYNWYCVRTQEFMRIVRLTYFELILFMTVGTVSLGMSYGFYLYGVSLITILYYVNYMSKRIGGEQIRESVVLSAILISYFFSYVHVNKFGPLYEINSGIERMFFTSNSLLVFMVLIIYMKIYIKLILRTENKLEDIALRDKLTGLYNRHYFFSLMSEKSPGDFKNYWIAILDIDNFKEVNDTYGHNCGDYVLKCIAAIVNDCFSDGTVCRWGGEEFIILAQNEKSPVSLLEEMRQIISDNLMVFEENKIRVTVTVGVEQYSENLGIDKWISCADAKLYEGKINGKNRIVI